MEKKKNNEREVGEKVNRRGGRGKMEKKMDRERSKKKKAESASMKQRLIGSQNAGQKMIGPE